MRLEKAGVANVKFYRTLPVVEAFKINCLVGNLLSTLQLRVFPK